MHRYAALVLALAACSREPVAVSKPRVNRVLQLMALVNPEAKCYPVATPTLDVPAPDTAYCAIGAKVLWCSAPMSKPPECQQIATREAEKPEPQVAPPPALPALPAKKEGAK